MGVNDGKVLDVSTLDLKSAAPVFQTQAEKLSEALRALVTTLDGLGKPWGQDSQGKKFEASYAPAQKKIESAAGMLVLGLTSIHQAMSDLAAGFGTQDAAVAAVFTKHGAGLPDGPAAPGGGSR